jgi:hypothetical protein
VKRTTPRGAGLRQMLIAADDAQRERWRRGPHYGWPAGTDWDLPLGDGDRALRAGEAVIVSSVELFGAFHHAGLSTAGWCRGDVNDGKRFVLDVQDRLGVYAG